MSLFDWVKKKSEKDETVFCWKCNQVDKLKNLRGTYVGVIQTVEGDCPVCGSVYIKPHLSPEKYG
jgi:hypothetical protein